ncbi:MAG TPA: plastocyanin/azurin family copper-binding protein [Solirubrobacteraceae bacterium]|nr:plastocyanin/azurin family copper-binding protein [Solirubrobacteraceae bacterium]
MHSLAIALSTVLAAEKSKVPFFIAGGLLVLWALVIALGFGLRDPRFPGDLQGQRTVSAITILLVLGAVSTAVITASPPTKTVTVTPVHQVSPASQQPLPGAPETSAPAASTTASGPVAGLPASTATSRSAGASTALKLTANPGGLLSYNTKQLNTKAGTVTITMTNMSPVEHNMTIAQGTTVLGATPTFTGGSRSVTLTLKPGTYTFYCSVPGHRQAGMEGTLTVS